MMRTTLTLDPDVAARIERLRSEREGSLKSLVNDLLRRGLADLEHGEDRRAAYRIRTHDAGRCLLPDLDSLHDALVVGEGEDYR